MVGAGKSFTIYIAFRMTSFVNFTCGLIAKFTDPSLGFWFYIYNSAGQPPEIEGSLGSNGSYSNYIYMIHPRQELFVNTNYILGIQYNAQASGSGGLNRLTMRTNGAVDDTEESSNGAGLTDITDNNEPLILGSWETYDDFNGYIMEVLILNGLPTTAERNNIESYLAMKWNASIPSIRTGAD